MFKKVISLALSVVFSLQTCGFAQVGQLNLAGYLGQGSGAPVLDRFRPASLRYFSYEPDSDNFKILLDKADEKDLSDVQVKDKADELMRYFRIGLSLPNDKFWVNLRPDAPEQIIDPALEQTDMGKIMLEADLQLKKDTSSLTSPQTKEGKEYWDKLYQKAGELFGTENITIPTITRPWIVPGEIIVRQSGNSAYIYKAALKVMLEEDYLKSSQLSAVSSQQYAFSDPRLKELNKYSTQLIRELIIPQLTKEVNRARRYAGLRQVYYSLILARWFKQSYQNSGATEHQGIRAPVNENNTLAKLIDSGSLTNLTSQEPWSKDTYYQGYKKSFEQGEYNLSQTVHTPTGQLIRRYVSGGISAGSALEVANYYDNPVGKIPVAANGIFFNYPSEGKTVAIASGSPLDLRLSLISSANALLESLGINIPMGTDLRTLRKILYKKTMEFNKNYTLSDMKNDRLINEWRRGMADLNKLSKTVSLAIIVEEMAEISRKLKEKTGSDIKETKLQGLSEKLVVKIEELKKYIASSALTLDEAKDRALGFKDNFLRVLKKNGGYKLWKNHELSRLFVSLFEKKELPSFVEGLEGFIKALEEGKGKFKKSYDDEKKNFQESVPLVHEWNKRWDNVSQAYGKMLAGFREIQNELMRGASSALTLEEAKESGIQRIVRIKHLDEEITREYVSRIMGAKNFTDIYNALDTFMVQNQKEKEPELILEKRRLKPGIFADALNKFKVTVERIEQPKFKHYKDPYPRFVIHLGGIELHLILRIHNADIKNNAYYAYGLNVYEDLKNGLGGDLYFSSGVPSGGGVIVTSMSEKMLGLDPEDLNILAEKIGEILGDSSVSSAVIADDSATVPNDIGAVDFRAMDMLIQPQGSFRGLDFSPVRLSSSALEAMDLDKSLEGIKQMVSGSMRPSPQRLKEYISACIFKGKIDEKADDFILSMLEVFQLQSEEGIESASQDREAVVLADTRGYVLPEKRLAASNS